MEDYDWIQLAFVFDEEPTLRTYEALLDTAPSNSGPEYDASEYNVKYRTGDTGTKQIYAEAGETLDAISNAQYWNIEVWMDRYGISIAFETGRGLLPDSETPTLTLSTTIHAFDDPVGDESLVETEQRRREFVDFLAATASILRPKWGFGRRGGIAIGDDETIEDLVTRTIPPLYEYNVFRPETVEAIGRDKILSAPAWFVEELDTGGVFLAVREPPQECSPAIDACLDVANHLGLVLARPERYY